MKMKKNTNQIWFAVCLSVAAAITEMLILIHPTKSMADSSAIAESACVQTTGGIISYNLDHHNYYGLDYSSERVASYVTENADGTFERVEYVDEDDDDDYVHIETYDNSMQLIESRKIEQPLPVFGGYFKGKNYKFLVCGQCNLKANDNREVLCVLKYDMSWNYIGQQSVKGSDTRIPFQAGSLRMTEGNGILYIHTCHQMYSYHQSNMTWACNEETLEIQYYDTGYVSHSFNQFIVADGEKIYRLDQGDAFPQRGLLLNKNDNSYVSKMKCILDISGQYGENDTGVCTGGFGKQGNWLITAGNSVNQDDNNYNPEDQRNIFVNLTQDSDELKFSDSVTFWLTKFENNANVKIGNPYLVIASDSYYVLWNETSTDQTKKFTKLVKMNTAGKITEGPYTLQVSLSDCQPIITSKNKMVWYVTNNTAPLFYILDLNQLSAYDNLEMVQKPTPSPVSTAKKIKKPSKTSVPSSTPTKLSTPYKKKVAKIKKAAIKKLTVKKNGAIRIQIKKLPEVSYYEVQYSLKKNFSKKKTQIFYGNSKILYLKKSKKYFIRVRAVKRINSHAKNTVLKGNWSKIKHIKNKETKES